MNKYKVTLAADSREFTAANKAESLRRFGTADPNAKVEVVEANLAPPPKHRYKVTWGPEVREVYAINEDDAWSQFVGGAENSIEYKYPKTYERIVEDLGPADDSVKPADETDETDDVAVSPVADLSAEDAKEKISHMHSVEKLQAIVDNDTRVTVRTAAQDKLNSQGNK